MTRTRSYQDLDPDERRRYDLLRRLERRARRRGPTRNGARAWRLRKAADAMLGLAPEASTFTVREHDGQYRTWRGSTTRNLNDRRS